MAFLPGKVQSYKKAINLFDWKSSLNNLDVNEQVSVFNEAIMNIMSNFGPNELVTCDDRDPPWMNRYIKNLAVARNDFHKKFVLPSSNMDNLFMFKNLQNQLIQSIYTAKQKHLLTKRLTYQHQVLLVIVKDYTKREKSTMHISYFS